MQSWVGLLWRAVLRNSLQFEYDAARGRCVLLQGQLFKCGTQNRVRRKLKHIFPYSSCKEDTPERISERMSEDMPEDMSEDVQERTPEDM